MSKLLTVYDDVDPLNNVVSALTMKVDEIFFVYHHDIPKKAVASIREVIGKYDPETKINFIKLIDDEYQLKQILEENRDLLIDIGGAKYLSLFLFEMVAGKDNKLLYYDDDEGCIKDYRSHTIITKKVFKLQIEDVLNLGGGKILSYMHKSVTDRETKNAVVSLVERNMENYASFTRYITKVNSIVNSCRYLGANTYQLDEHDRNNIMTDMVYKNSPELFTIDERNRLKFRNKKIREMVEVSGAFLENYLYIKLTESGLFDDVKMSTVIDFSDERYSYPVRCEIDCLIIKDNKLLFVSCKSNKADTEALNEIYVHNHHFGNVLSLPVLCVCEEMDRKYPSTYAKGEELGVYLVDRSSFLDHEICEVFESILNDTYVYDDVM